MLYKNIFYHWFFVFQICQILHNVCKKEGLSIPPELSKRIAEKSNRNLRRALLMCEACRVQQYVFFFVTFCVSVQSVQIDELSIIIIIIIIIINKTEFWSPLIQNFVFLH